MKKRILTLLLTSSMLVACGKSKEQIKEEQIKKEQKQKEQELKAEQEKKYKEFLEKEKTEKYKETLNEEKNKKSKKRYVTELKNNRGLEITGITGSTHFCSVKVMNADLIISELKISKLKITDEAMQRLNKFKDKIDVDTNTDYLLLEFVFEPEPIKKRETTENLTCDSLILTSYFNIYSGNTKLLSSPAFTTGIEDGFFSYESEKGKATIRRITSLKLSDLQDIVFKTKEDTFITKIDISNLK